VQSSAVVAISEQEYASRRDRLGALLEERWIDVLFVAPSSDLEYLTGIERDLPSFGNISYAHGWVAGRLPRARTRARLRPPADGRRLPSRRGGAARRARGQEAGDGRASFAEAVRSLGEPRRIALGQRVWAETVIELRQVVPDAELGEGSSLVNELRRVKSEPELKLMAAACLIARDAMDAVTPHVIPGVAMTTSSRRSSTSCAAVARTAPRFPRTSSPGVSVGSTRVDRRSSIRCGTERPSSSTSAGSSTVTAPTSAARSPAASRRPATTKPGARCSRPRRPGEPLRSLERSRVR
jgi:hypothetical protein